MKPHPRLIVRSLLLTAASLFLAGGCSFAPRVPDYAKGNRAFIAYWPPEKGSERLRLAVKDNIDIKGVVTTAGSQYLAVTGRPAAKDAACLAIARSRNVQFVGKANLSEFAVTPSGINEYFGTPKNPFDRWIKLIPGGSSSGSAVAVASGLADVAFGTDTAGSVRVPAASCGVVGLKTTHGLVPLDGVRPVEPEHLDTVGPLARDIAGTVQGMDLLQAGFASRYAAAKSTNPSARSIRVGRLRLKGTNPSVDEAVDRALAAAGFTVIPLDDAFREKWDLAQKDGNTVAGGGVWLSNRQYRYLYGVSAQTTSAILTGRLIHLTGYPAALKRRAAWQRTLRSVYRKVDLIALPTLQTIPPPIPPNLRIGVLEALVLDMQNTAAVSFAGNPALAMPIPLEDSSVPVTSLQLVGPPRSEADLLNAGRLVELAVKIPKRR